MVDDINSMFSEAQHATIVELSQKIVKLEEERDHLKLLLESTPLVQGEKLVSVGYNLEENIAKVQLALLNQRSMQQELTLEETKKCEIFSKILTAIRNSGIKNVDNTISKLKSEDLLAQLESSADGG